MQRSDPPRATSRPAATPEPQLRRSTRSLRYDPARFPEPTRSDPQSKLWFHDRAWWALMVNPTSGQLHIYRLDQATQRWTDTQTAVDDRPRPPSDVLWDGRALYVLSGGPKDYQRDHLRLSRYRYLATTAGARPSSRRSEGQAWPRTKPPSSPTPTG